MRISSGMIAVGARDYTGAIVPAGNCIVMQCS